jgi:hypothetical protein
VAAVTLQKILLLLPRHLEVQQSPHSPLHSVLRKSSRVDKAVLPNIRPLSRVVTTRTKTLDLGRQKDLNTEAFQAPHEDTVESVPQQKGNVVPVTTSEGGISPETAGGPDNSAPQRFHTRCQDILYQNRHDTRFPTLNKNRLDLIRLCSFNGIRLKFDCFSYFDKLVLMIVKGNLMDGSNGSFSQHGHLDLIEF